MLAGVLGGVADYFGMDPTLFRLGFVVLLFVTGVIPATLAYLAAWVIVPNPEAITP